MTMSMADQSGMTAERRISRFGRRGGLLVGLLVAVLCAGLACGCSQRDSDGAESDAGLFLEAVAVRQVFESAPASYRNPVRELLALVKAGSVNPAAYAEALPHVEKLAANPTVSPEQKQALKALAQRLRSELSNRRSVSLMAR
jgi:hypothetical protein